MSAQQAVENLAKALTATRIIEPVTQTHKDGAVEILCRVNPHQHERWLKLITAIKLAEERDADQPYKWRSRIFLEYFLKNKQLVKGWMFFVQSGMLLDAIEVISSCLRIGKQAPTLNKQVVDIMEMPLSGLPANFDRNAPKPARNSDGSIKYGEDGKPIPGRSAREFKG